jgi:hypothetical protein
MAEEIALMKLSLELKVESLEILKHFGHRLSAAEADLREIRRLFTESLGELGEIRRSFSESLNKFFEIKEFPPGLGEAVISELNPGPAPAGG